MFQRQETLQGPMLIGINPLKYVSNKEGITNILTHMNAMKADDNDFSLVGMLE